MLVGVVLLTDLLWEEDSRVAALCSIAKSAPFGTIVVTNKALARLQKTPGSDCVPHEEYTAPEVVNAATSWSDNQAFYLASTNVSAGCDKV